MLYTFVDYWNNGNIDVMSGGKLIAEVKPRNERFKLDFSICVYFETQAEMKEWVDKHINEMISISDDICEEDIDEYDDSGDEDDDEDEVLN